MRWGWKLQSWNGHHTAAHARRLFEQGLAAAERGDTLTARARYEESLAIARELGDQAQIAAVLGNLRNLASDEEDSETASRRSLRLQRQDETARVANMRSTLDEFAGVPTSEE